jgi:hypothetical protein
MNFRHYALPIVAAAATCGLAATLPASAATTVRGAPALAGSVVNPAVEVCGQGPALTRPASMILTCADDGELAGSLHWTSWSRTKATATGKVIWRTCRPLCAESRQDDNTSADWCL